MFAWSNIDGDGCALRMLINFSFLWWAMGYGQDDARTALTRRVEQFICCTIVGSYIDMPSKDKYGPTSRYQVVPMWDKRFMRCMLGHKARDVMGHRTSMGHKTRVMGFITSRNIAKVPKELCGLIIKGYIKAGKVVCGITRSILVVGMKVGGQTGVIQETDLSLRDGGRIPVSDCC